MLTDYAKTQKPASGICFKAASTFLTHFELAPNCTFSVDGMSGLPCPPGFNNKLVQSFTLLYYNLQWISYTTDSIPEERLLVYCLYQNWKDRISFCIDNTVQTNIQPAFYHTSEGLCILKAILDRL